MSKQLLSKLNGNKNGKFSRYLDNLNDEPRIAWYLSAGTDFRPLLYLHPRFTEISQPSKPDPAPPDIFLFTDYFPWQSSDFLDTPKIHIDDRTEVIVTHIEELPNLHIPLDEGIVDCPQGSSATGKVIFLEVKIKSTILGEYTYPVVYAFAENESFCAKKILPLNGRISHVIHVRYGGGCGGGGKASGIWIDNVLRRLFCEVVITDGHYYQQSGDDEALIKYPELAPYGEPPKFEPIRTVRSEAWSNHGNVNWELIL
ncbi:MAG: hypothetical protein WCI71_11290 [Bacteroidota bacterium]